MSSNSSVRSVVGTMASSCVRELAVKAAVVAMVDMVVCRVDMVDMMAVAVDNSGMMLVVGIVEMMVAVVDRLGKKAVVVDYNCDVAEDLDDLD